MMTTCRGVVTVSQSRGGQVSAEYQRPMSHFDKAARPQRIIVSNQLVDAPLTGLSFACHCACLPHARTYCSY
ncbi:hypothetical protein J6590_071974 [Homalodisca vitripennis]|nr:hypothetical protein J6590_071974 [Homalodisca vitripennis]